METDQSSEFRYGSRYPAMDGRGAAPRGGGGITALLGGVGMRPSFWSVYALQRWIGALKFPAWFVRYVVCLVGRGGSLAMFIEGSSTRSLPPRGIVVN